jgi:hypothetical protein
MAIAREHNKVLSRQDYPMLEQTAIMSGDLIELKGTYISRAALAAPPTPQHDHGNFHPTPNPDTADTT